MFRQSHRAPSPLHLVKMRNAQQIDVAHVVDLYRTAVEYINAAERGNATLHGLGAVDPLHLDETRPTREELRHIQDDWTAAGGNWFGDDNAKVPIAMRAVRLAVAVRQDMAGAPLDIPPELLAAAGLRPDQLTVGRPATTWTDAFEYAKQKTKEKSIKK